jgi:hypothetical protein
MISATTAPNMVPPNRGTASGVVPLTSSLMVSIRSQARDAETSL